MRLINKIISTMLTLAIIRNNPPEVFLRKYVLKICSKFTGEHPCRSHVNKVALELY